MNPRAFLTPIAWALSLALRLLYSLKNTRLQDLLGFEVFWHLATIT